MSSRLTGNINVDHLKDNDAAVFMYKLETLMEQYRISAVDVCWRYGAEWENKPAEPAPDSEQAEQEQEDLERGAHPAPDPLAEEVLDGVMERENQHQEETRPGVTLREGEK